MGDVEMDNKWVMWKWTIMWDNKWHRISNTFQILWITCKGCLNIKIQQLFGQSIILYFVQQLLYSQIILSNRDDFLIHLTLKQYIPITITHPYYNTLIPTTQNTANTCQFMSQHNNQLQYHSDEDQLDKPIHKQHQFQYHSDQEAKDKSQIERQSMLNQVMPAKRGRPRKKPQDSTKNRTYYFLPTGKSSKYQIEQVPNTRKLRSSELIEEIQKRKDMKKLIIETKHKLKVCNAHKVEEFKKILERCIQRNPFWSCQKLANYLQVRKIYEKYLGHTEKDCYYVIRRLVQEFGYTRIKLIDHKEVKSPELMVERLEFSKIYKKILETEPTCKIYYFGHKMLAGLYPTDMYVKERMGQQFEIENAIRTCKASREFINLVAFSEEDGSVVADLTDSKISQEDMAEILTNLMQNIFRLTHLKDSKKAYLLGNFQEDYYSDVIETVCAQHNVQIVNLAKSCKEFSPLHFFLEDMLYRCSIADRVKISNEQIVKKVRLFLRYIEFNIKSYETKSVNFIKGISIVSDRCRRDIKEELNK